MVPKADECYSTVAYLELKKKMTSRIFSTIIALKLLTFLSSLQKKKAQLKGFLYKNETLKLYEILEERPVLKKLDRLLPFRGHFGQVNQTCNRKLVSASLRNRLLGLLASVLNFAMVMMYS